MNPVSGIIAAVEQRYGLPSGAVLSHSKQRRFAWPRQLAMYLARVQLGWSYPRIAKAFERKDHTTVMHACRVLPSRLMRYPNIGQDLMAIDAAVSYEKHRGSPRVHLRQGVAA